MIKKTIYIYLFFTLLSRSAISFMAATYVIFLMSHGLNIFEVGLVNGVFYATLLICEIPTGVFADIFGRKKSYVLSYFLLSASMFLYSASDSLLGFMIAESIAAFGITFGEGAFTSWLKDKLDHHGYNGQLKSIFSKEAWMTQIASGLSALAGAFLAEKNMALPWIVGGAVFLIGGILATLFIKEEYFKKEKFFFKESYCFAKTALKQGFKNKAIKFMLLIGFVQFFAIQASNMQWQPFFSDFISEKKSFGYIYLGISFFIILGSVLSPIILKKMRNDEVKFLAVSQIAIGAGMFFCVLSPIFGISLSFLFFHEFARGLFAPIGKDYIHKNISSKTKERATIISLEKTSHHIGGAVGLIASGLLAYYSSIATTWIVFGAFLSFATLWIYLRQKRLNN